MRNANRALFYILIFLLGAFAVSLVILAFRANAETDAEIAEIDKRIETFERALKKTYEPETVSLSYEEWKKAQLSEEGTTFQEEPETAEKPIETVKEAEATQNNEVSELPDIYTMDVWTLGSYLYGIPEYDTTRALVLITFEGYGAESPLSYYVACCCWVRATEGYWGYGNLYSAFGEADTWNYGEWLDNYGYADYAVEVLRQCYLNPSYVRYCNGMMIPDTWVYEEGGIYAW